MACLSTVQYSLSRTAPNTSTLMNLFRKCICDFPRVLINFSFFHLCTLIFKYATCVAMVQITSTIKSLKPQNQKELICCYYTGYICFILVRKLTYNFSLTRSDTLLFFVPVSPNVCAVFRSKKIQDLQSITDKIKRTKTNVKSIQSGIFGVVSKADRH